MPNLKKFLRKQLIYIFDYVTPFKKFRYVCVMMTILIIVKANNFAKIRSYESGQKIAKDGQKKKEESS